MIVVSGNPESPGPAEAQSGTECNLEGCKSLDSARGGLMATPDLEAAQVVILKLQREIESLRKEREEEERVLNQMQAEIHRNDFCQEREDRSNAVRVNEALKDEMKRLQKQLDECKALLGAGGVASKEMELEEMAEVGNKSCDVREQLASKSRDLSAAREEVAKMMGELQIERAVVASVRAELEAAREEIAVKVAQVKQYQKQVEAYKQQVGILHIKTQEAERETKDASDTLIIEICASERGPATTIPPSPPPSTHTSNSVSSSDVPQKEAIRMALCEPEAPPRCPDHSNDCTHPPPLVPTMPRPKDVNKDGTMSSLAHGGGSTTHTNTSVQCCRDRNPPSSQQSQLGALDVSHVTPPVGHVMPPANHMTHPVYNRAVSHDLPSSASNPAMSLGLAGGIDGDIRRVAASVQRDTAGWGGGLDETGEFAPLDPNLRCPTCGKAFKKGRIQKYKRHVQMCQ
eukprot:Em1081g1a